MRRFGSHFGQHRGRLLSLTAALQTLLLGASAVLAARSGSSIPPGYSYGLVVMLGIAMGLQNAIARKLAVPDLTTTVLTLTIFGIGADSRLVGGSGSRAGRRLTAVGAMAAGALAGNLLILHGSIVAPLLIALIITAVVAVTARALSTNIRVFQVPRLQIFMRHWSLAAGDGGGGVDGNAAALATPFT